MCGVSTINTDKNFMKNKLQQLATVLTICMVSFIVNTVSAQWASQTSPTTNPLDQVCFMDANNGYALGVQGPTVVVFTLLKTTNGGASWNNNTISNIHYGPFSMYFTSATTGFAGGVDTIFKTTNGGSSWSPVHISHPGSSAGVFSIYFYNATIGYACLFDYTNNLTYMLHTSDGGATWTAVAGGTVAGIGSNNMVATNANTCYVVGFNGATNGLFKTTDGGATWNFLSNMNLSDCHSINYLGANTFLAAAGGNGILRSLDGGVTWNQVYSNNFNSDISSIQVLNSSTVVAAGTGAAIVSYDAGSTWIEMLGSITNEALNSINFPTNSIGYTVGDGGVIFKYSGFVGIQENESEITAVIYPNPANDAVTISTSKLIDNDCTLNIYNIAGELVKSEKVVKNQQQINTVDLANGCYIIELKSDNIIGKQKLVIQR